MPARCMQVRIMEVRVGGDLFDDAEAAQRLRRISVPGQELRVVDRESGLETATINGSRNGLLKSERSARVTA